MEVPDYLHHRALEILNIECAAAQEKYEYYHKLNLSVNRKRAGLTKEKRKEFEEASRPLMSWLSENCHPHVTVILDSGRSELLESICNFPTEDYIKD